MSLRGLLLFAIYLLQSAEARRSTCSLSHFEEAKPVSPPMIFNGNSDLTRRCQNSSFSRTLIYLFSKCQYITFLTFRNKFENLNGYNSNNIMHLAAKQTRKKPENLIWLLCDTFGSERTP